MRRALSGIAAIGLVLALLEGAASLAYTAFWARTHWWSPLPERAHTAYDAELGWVAVPGRVSRDVFGPGLHVTTNARGFRGARELAAEVPPGVTRVVALGDSFTLGYDVGDADAWPAWLERECPGVEAPNMGQSGYGIDQSLLWYRRDGGGFAHRALVLAFIDDDLRRVRADSMAGYGKPVLALRDGALVATNVPVPRAPYLWPALSQNASLLGELRLVALPRALLARLARAPEPPGSSRSASGDDDEAGRLVEAILRALRAEAAARGAELVLVHLPHLATGRPDALAELPAFATGALARVTADGVRFADLREEMSRVPDPERRALFQPHTLENGPGAHYSAEGNRFVARAIAARLAAFGVIPPGACAAPSRDAPR